MKQAVTPSWLLFQQLSNNDPAAVATLKHFREKCFNVNNGFIKYFQVYVKKKTKLNLSFHTGMHV